jgi:hypothetical protein
VSVKTVYGLINSGRLPHVVIAQGKRKRLVRIRTVVAENWILEHEVGTTPDHVIKSPRHRRRSILRTPKGVTALNSLKNEGESAGGNSKNV